MRSLGYWELISGNRNFRNLLAGQFISELGNWFNFIAGLGLVRVVSGESPRAAAILFLCRLLPFSLLSPIAGTLVDRLSRRKVMLWADIARVFVALAFLFINDGDDLWIAYFATTLLAGLGAFFDGAKNAATPNLTGRDGLLSGTALLFSTRFLLMAIGSALGGWAAAYFGYKVAFIINAISFSVSAFTVWLIPEDAVKETDLTSVHERISFLRELKEGFRYAVGDHFALTILLMNIIWAVGGGAINMIYERIGGVYFHKTEGWDSDAAVGILWFWAGAGLTLGMLIAHRVSGYLDLTKRNSLFIGSALILHGVLFSIAGMMPTLFLFCVFSFISRAIVGVEYAVQETLFQRSLPDRIRGRISTLDRGAEMTVFGIVSYASGDLMYYITPQMLTIISGISSALAGVIWFEIGRAHV